MAIYIDDNFGTYTIECEEDIAHYRDVQRRSVRKTCRGCGRKVRLLPDYVYCDSCTRKVEQGWDI